MFLCMKSYILNKNSPCCDKVHQNIDLAFRMLINFVTCDTILKRILCVYNLLYTLRLKTPSKTYECK